MNDNDISALLFEARRRADPSGGYWTRAAIIWAVKKAYKIGKSDGMLKAANICKSITEVEAMIGCYRQANANECADAIIRNNRTLGKR